MSEDTQVKKSPAILKIAAFLFLLNGLFACISMISSFSQGIIDIDFSVLCILIVPGLLRFNRTWRTIALVYIWLGLAFQVYGVLIWLSHGGFPVGPVLVGAILLFQYYVLTRSDIRQLFVGMATKTSLGV